jgi:hypothetical protein
MDGYTSADHLAVAYRQLGRANSLFLAGRYSDAMEEMIAARASTTRAILQLPKPAKTLDEPDAA